MKKHRTSCKHCGRKIQLETYKEFCSRSCVSKYHNEQRYKDNKEPCKICGELVRSRYGYTKGYTELSRHVEEKHDISYQEYYNNYLKNNENDGKCIICGKSTRFSFKFNRYKITCSNNCAGELGRKVKNQNYSYKSIRRNTHKNKNLIEKHVAVCNICKIEITKDTSEKVTRAFNRHIREEHNIDPIIYTESYLYNKDKVYCHICKRDIVGYSTISAYKLLSNHFKRYHKELTHKEYYDKYVRKDGEGVCTTCGKETGFISLRYGYKKVCNYSCNSMMCNKLGYSKPKKQIYKGIKLRSILELRFAQVLDENNIEWQYEPETFIVNYTVDDKTRRRYTPDFYLPQQDVWIEIKPTRFITDWLLGLKDKFEEVTGNKLYILNKKCFTSFIDNMTP